MFSTLLMCAFYSRQQYFKSNLVLSTVDSSVSKLSLCYLQQIAAFQNQTSAIYSRSSSITKSSSCYLQQIAVFKKQMKCHIQQIAVFQNQVCAICSRQQHFKIKFVLSTVVAFKSQFNSIYSRKYCFKVNLVLSIQQLAAYSRQQCSKSKCAVYSSR